MYFGFGLFACFPSLKNGIRLLEKCRNSCSNSYKFVFSCNTVKSVSIRFVSRVTRIYNVSCLCLIYETRFSIRVVFVFSKFVSCKFVSNTYTRHANTYCQV